MTTNRTRIDAGMIVAFQSGAHRILKGGCVVIEGQDIVHVGKSYTGEVDEVVEASSKLVTPGFINVHTHLSESPLDKSFVEDVGRRAFYNSKLPDLLPGKLQAMDEEAARACIDYSLVELLRTGTTTVMELGGMGDEVAEAVERVGLRAYIADGYRSGHWYTDDGYNVKYTWEERAGEEGFARALALVARLEGRAEGRVQGFLSPMQVDTCTPELLQASREASDRLELPLALHVSQSVFEFDEMVRRHGLTPLEWLEQIGFLSERCILGHAIIPAGHSYKPFPGDDLAIMARYGVSVAHCPWVFARSGIMLESFSAYQDAGINLCLGTDTAPQSMIEALRWAGMLGKISQRQATRATAADVFNAATLNAAKALGRDDLGRVAPGAKADLLFWSAESLFMTPLRDPIRNLAFSAQAEDLLDVMVDGRWVMRERNMLHADERQVTARLQAAGERMWQRLGPGDWAKRPVDEMSPPSFDAFEDL